MSSSSNIITKDALVKDLQRLIKPTQLRDKLIEYLRTLDGRAFNESVVDCLNHLFPNASFFLARKQTWVELTISNCSDPLLADQNIFISRDYGKPARVNVDTIIATNPDLFAEVDRANKEVQKLLSDPAELDDMLKEINGYLVAYSRFRKRFRNTLQAVRYVIDDLVSQQIYSEEEEEEE